MNKEQLTIVLQACLFAFDGCSEQEIEEYNPHYPKELVHAGVILSDYFKSIKVNSPKKIKNGKSGL